MAEQPLPGPEPWMRELQEAARQWEERVRAQALPENQVDLAAIKARVEREVAARRLGFVGIEEAPLALPRVAFEPLSLPRVGAAAPAIEYRDAYHLDDILVYNDVDFVRNAYRAVLRREPDPNAAQWREALYRGTLSKVDVIAGLRASPEGRAAGVRIRGLRLAALVRRMKRVPLLGSLFGIGFHLLRLPVLARSIERQEVALLQRATAMRATVDEMAASVEARFNQAIAAASESTAATAEALSRLEREKSPRALPAILVSRVVSLQSEVQTVSDGTRAGLEELRRQLAASLGTLNRAASRVEELDLRLASRIAELEKAARGEPRLAADTRLDEFYLAFEDRMRGTQEDVRNRVSVYVPYVTKAGAGTARAPVLDLGSGRGEWLEVLREAGLEARGVDMNAAMARDCRARGLDVTEGDALEYLARLPDRSLGAVTGMHVVEHFTFRQRIALLDQALRVLVPGGLAILETPNPENLTVGGNTFWTDPTHISPIPPQAMQVIAELRGFHPVEILRLHPMPAEMHLPLDPSAMRDALNHVLYGPQDYSILAYRP